MVQVCLDHAEHIYISKVKNTESKRCIGSNQLNRVYTRAQPMQPALCCVQSVACVCTLQPLSSQPVLSVSVSEPASLHIDICQAYEYCGMCVRTMTEHVSVPQCGVHVVQLQSQLSYTWMTLYMHHKLWPADCFRCRMFRFGIFYFLYVDVCGMIQTDLDHETQTIFATFEYIYYLKVSAVCSKICEIYVLLHIN